MSAQRSFDDAAVHDVGSSGLAEQLPDRTRLLVIEFIDVAPL